MKLSGLLRGIGVEVDTLNDAEVHGVTSDSRSVDNGFVFVAINGSSFDGHSKIADAIVKGAICIVAELSAKQLYEKFATLPAGSLSNLNVVTVSSSRKALAELTVGFLNSDHPWLQEMKVFGVTGTNGKTTVATLLHQLFRFNNIPSGFIGTTGIMFNEEVAEATHTTPHPSALFATLQEMHQSGIRYVCMEVSSHALHQYRTHGIPFAGAFFTNLSRDHIDYHGSMDMYDKTKKSFFDNLPDSAVAVFHGLSEWTAYMKRNCKAKQIINVGERAHNNVRITDVVTTARGSSYTLNLADGPIHISTPMIGRFNVFNTALCATMAHAHGVPKQGIVDALKAARGPAGRMERYDLPNGAVVVIDYAHSPDALHNALSVLRELRGDGGRLLLVFGCGGNRDKGKRPEMGRIAAELADVIWLTNDNPRNEDPTIIIQNIMGGIEGTTQPVTIELDRKKAIWDALSKAQPSDIVLIAGKGHETVQIVGELRIEFSDSQVVREYN